MNFVVTGTPRSATGFASKLFSSLGVECTHERIFRPRSALQDMLEWHTAGAKAESSWLAWLFMPLLPAPVPMLHTVRQPWGVVDSLAHRNDILPKEAEKSQSIGKRLLRDTIAAYCPDVFEHDGAVDRAAAFVVTWNDKIEATAEQTGCPYIRYKADELAPEVLAKLLQFVGVHREMPEVERALRDMPRSVNAGNELEYEVKIKHPLILAYLQETNPDTPPVLARVLRKGVKRTPEEVAALAAPELREAVDNLCERYGYAPTSTARGETANERIAVG